MVLKLEKYLGTVPEKGESRSCMFRCDNYQKGNSCDDPEVYQKRKCYNEASQREAAKATREFFGDPYNCPSNKRSEKATKLTAEQENRIKETMENWGISA